jgi:hypothetical protein
VTSELQRYRILDGRARIELSAREAQQLFDRRDPAPLGARDLDEETVEYVIGAAQEIPRQLPLSLVVSLSTPPDPGVPDALIVEAIRGHFAFARVQIGRRLRQHVRRGRTALGVGLVVLVACLALAQLAVATLDGPVRDVIREGLVITGWVAMWRPLDLLLYDWWPLIDERRHLDRVLAAEVAIVHSGPEPAR